MGRKCRRPHPHHACRLGMPIAATSPSSSATSARRRVKSSAVHDTEPLEGESSAVDHQPVRLEPGQSADELVGRQFACCDRSVDRAGVVVQALAALLEEHEVLSAALGSRTAQRQGALKLVENRALARLVAVQLETRVAQVHGVEAALHDLQGGHLLRDEENRLAAGERLAHQVRDRLRLARPGRSLDDQVEPAHGVEHREGLRAVRVHDRVQAGPAEVAVDVRVLAEPGGLVPEPLAAEEPPDDRMVGRLVPFGPALGVQVLVDEQLVEREEAKVDLVRLDRPAGLPRHRPPDPAQIVVDVEIVLGRHLGEPDAEVLLQLGLKREVRLDVVARPRELEVLAHVRPGEPDGHEDQRCAPLPVAGV